MNVYVNRFLLREACGAWRTLRNILKYPVVCVYVSKAFSATCCCSSAAVTALAGCTASQPSPRPLVGSSELALPRAQVGLMSSLLPRCLSSTYSSAWRFSFSHKNILHSSPSYCRWEMKTAACTSAVQHDVVEIQSAQYVCVGSARSQPFSTFFMFDWWRARAPCAIQLHADTLGGKVTGTRRRFRRKSYINLLRDWSSCVLYGYFSRDNPACFRHEVCPVIPHIYSTMIVVVLAFFQRTLRWKVSQ